METREESELRRATFKELAESPEAMAYKDAMYKLDRAMRPVVEAAFDELVREETVAKIPRWKMRHAIRTENSIAAALKRNNPAL